MLQRVTRAVVVTRPRVPVIRIVSPGSVAGPYRADSESLEYADLEMVRGCGWHELSLSVRGCGAVSPSLDPQADQFRIFLADINTRITEAS